MANQTITSVPSLFIKNQGENSSAKYALLLTRAANNFVVRLTGGCGYMSEEDAKGLYGLFLHSLIGFDGAMLFGGTRMIRKDDNSVIVPGITEIPPFIKEHCPNAIFQGVIPKTGDLQLSDCGMVVSNGDDDDYLTIVHPQQDAALIVQANVDDGVVWEAEFKECLKIIQYLREFAQWRSLLIAYNGGGTTKKEIIAHAKLGWPVLLIKGSGRVSDELSNDKQFLMQYPSISIVQKDPALMRRALIELNVIKNNPNGLQAVK